MDKLTILSLAELKGYVSALLDIYDNARKIDDNMRIPAKRVADDFYRVYEFITDMINTQGYKG